MKQSRTLKQSFISSHLLVALVPLGIIGVVILLFIVQSVRDDFFVKFKIVSQSARGQIQLFIDQPTSFLRTIATLVQSDELELDSITDILNTHLAESLFFESIYLLDKKGNVVSAGLKKEREHYRSELLGISLGHKREFKAVVDGHKFQWSNTFLSLSSGKISLTLYMPAGRYVLAADINLNPLAELISKLSQDNVIVTVIDRNGAIIIHPDPALMGRSIMMNTVPIVRSALEGIEHTAEFSFKNKQYYGSTSIIHETGWVTLFAEPKIHFINRLKAPLLVFGVGLLGALALSIVLSVFKAKKLAQPIIKMTEQSSDIAAGNYSSTLSTDGVRELAGLAGSINFMANSIKQREAEQKEYEKKRRKLELKEQQSQKMELLGLMAGGVAHDLNNILAGIINYPELILMQLDQDSHLRPKLEAVKNSGERAAAVVADLLTVARGTAAERKVVNIKQLICTFLESPEFNSLRERYPHVEFTFNGAKNTWCCKCSPVHIEKVIMNLTVNAFEAVGFDGRVSIRCCNVTPPELPDVQPPLPPGGYVLVTVRDNGEGISEPNQRRIFEPFFSRKTLGRSGTGLGLSVALSTVQEHGGTISVESSPSGSMFSIYLPATEEKHADKLADNEGISKFLGKGEMVLVVDDEAHLRDIASEILRALNYRTHSVASGEEALAYLQKSSADIVLLDMQMAPGMSGKETYEQICRLNPGQKAIIASGYSTSNDVKETLERGAGAFIKKPYSLGSIGKTIKQVLEE